VEGIKKNGKSGSAIVEATMVFPLVILAVVTLLYILISLYEMSAVQSRMHLLLRHEEGNITDTSYTSGYGANFVPEDKYGRRAFDAQMITFEAYRAGNRQLCVEYEKARGSKGLLRTFIKEQSSSVFIIDEETFIRRADLLKNNQNDQNHQSDQNESRYNESG